MPIYEFKCLKCSTIFETITASSAVDDVRCESCGSAEINKLISAGAIKVPKGTSPASASGCQARGGFT